MAVLGATLGWLLNERVAVMLTTIVPSRTLFEDTLFSLDTEHWKQQSSPLHDVTPGTLSTSSAWWVPRPNLQHPLCPQFSFDGILIDASQHDAYEVKG